MAWRMVFLPLTQKSPILSYKSARRRLSRLMMKWLSGLNAFRAYVSSQTLLTYYHSNTALIRVELRHAAFHLAALSFSTLSFATYLIVFLIADKFDILAIHCYWSCRCLFSKTDADLLEVGKSLPKAVDLNLA